eukprot:7213815-Prymnesium_polylepis.2
MLAVEKSSGVSQHCHLADGAAVEESRVDVRRRQADARQGGRARNAGFRAHDGAEVVDRLQEERRVVAKRAIAPQQLGEGVVADVLVPRTVELVADQPRDDGRVVAGDAQLEAKPRLRVRQARCGREGRVLRGAHLEDRDDGEVAAEGGVEEEGVASGRGEGVQAHLPHSG